MNENERKNENTFSLLYKSNTTQSSWINFCLIDTHIQTQKKEEKQQSIDAHFMLRQVKETKNVIRIIISIRRIWLLFQFQFTEYNLLQTRKTSQ